MADLETCAELGPGEAFVIAVLVPLVWIIWIVGIAPGPLAWLGAM